MALRLIPSFQYFRCQGRERRDPSSRAEERCIVGKMPSTVCLGFLLAMGTSVQHWSWSCFIYSLCKSSVASSSAWQQCVFLHNPIIPWCHGHRCLDLYSRLSAYWPALLPCMFETFPGIGYWWTCSFPGIESLYMFSVLPLSISRIAKFYKRIKFRPVHPLWEAFPRSLSFYARLDPLHCAHFYSWTYFTVL